MAINIGRRQFISAFGGTALAWPLAARAQPADRSRRVGFLIGAAANANEGIAPEALRLFREAMREAGWNEGQNVVVDYRFSAGDVAGIGAAVEQLVSLRPDVICVLGLSAAQAARDQTRTIPVVFTRVADPVGYGLVASLNHPGGNLTGFMTWDLSIGGKWLQLLLELAPQLRSVGILYNPGTGGYAAPLIASAKAAAPHAVTIIEQPVHTDQDIEVAVDTLGRAPNSGLVVIPEPFTNARRDRIIALTTGCGLSTMLPIPGATKGGALVSYTYTLEWSIQQPVTYIDRILKGQAPGELPVQAPTKYELSINLKTAKALRLTVSPSLLVSADEVIE
jgi:putative ABC transport system substrate-binding protein